MKGGPVLKRSTDSVQRSQGVVCVCPLVPEQNEEDKVLEDTEGTGCPSPGPGGVGVWCRSVRGVRGEYCSGGGVVGTGETRTPTSP